MIFYNLWRYSQKLIDQVIDKAVTIWTTQLFGISLHQSTFQYIKLFNQSICCNLLINTRQASKWFYSLWSGPYRNGANWLHIRSVLNPHLLKPVHVSLYGNTINAVVTDFMGMATWLRENQGQGVMIHNLAQELYKFAFEGQLPQAAPHSHMYTHTQTLPTETSLPSVKNGKPVCPTTPTTSRRGLLSQFFFMDTSACTISFIVLNLWLY